MRYYEIVIKDGADGRQFTWSSQSNGVFNPSALQVEFDIPVAPYSVPIGGASITLHGIDLDMLKYSQTFVDMSFEMKAGMQRGLPLANPAQAGTILKGTVYQSFGNWVGTDLSLTFVVLAGGPYTLDRPGNIVLAWGAGTKLSDSLMNMFNIAYPDTPVSMNISDDIVLSHDEQHYSATLEGVASFVLDVTDGAFRGPTYPGVQIAIQGGKIIVYDQTVQTKLTKLEFTDFIGQPGWQGVGRISMMLVMRHDIEVGSFIQMPQGLQNQPGQITTNAISNQSQLKNSLLGFNGRFVVQEVRHIGNFRSPNGQEWVTVVHASPAP